MINDQEKIVGLLATHWELLGKSLDSLRRSVSKAAFVPERAEYSFEEMETFDSLTSKFSRTSDFFLQKIIRTIWELLHEDPMPLIDLLNRAEKLGIIASADQLLEIRDIRNQIAHEYIPETIQELIPEVIELSELLIDNIMKCEKFLRSRNWVN